MPQPVIDIGSNLNENLERWSYALERGGAKLAVFEVIYSGKRARWSAKEISDRLGESISASPLAKNGPALLCRIDPPGRRVTGDPARS